MAQSLEVATRVGDAGQCVLALGELWAGVVRQRWTSKEEREKHTETNRMGLPESWGACRNLASPLVRASCSSQPRNNHRGRSQAGDEMHRPRFSRGFCRPFTAWVFCAYRAA